MNRAALGLLVIVSVGLTACTTKVVVVAPSTTTTAATSTTTAPGGNVYPVITEAQAAADYTTEIAPFDAALSAFNTDLKENPPTTPAEAEADAVPVVTAIRTLDPHLLNLAGSYQPVSADMMAVTADLATLQGDFASFSVDYTDVNGWGTQYLSDLSKTDEAGDVVRSALGISS